MREIKFRAWSKKERYMKTTRQAVNTVVQKFILDIPDKEDFILMQYISLRDKSNREIYEGDIVHVEAVAYGRNMSAVIIWRDGGFWLKWEDGYESYVQDWTKELTESEIIGNIYENPELVR